MCSYETTTRRICTTVARLASSRSVRSCARARVYWSRAAWAAHEGTADSVHTAVTSAARTGCLIGNRLSQLGIHFVEVFLLHEHLARLAAGRGGDEAVQFHHVDEPGRAAESDPEPPLQIRDRRLAARHDDAGGLVVDLVLVELHVLLRPLFVRRDGGVVGGLALFPQEARQPGAFLFGDVEACILSTSEAAD